MAQILEQESIHQAMNLCPFLTHLPQKELYARYVRFAQQFSS